MLNRILIRNFVMATFEQVKAVPQHSEIYLIDVRENKEIQETGSIPGSINIPLGNVENALKMSDDEFLKSFNRAKPAKDSPVIFSCLSGRRAANAAKIIEQMGFEKVQVYQGSWTEWAEKTKA